TTLGLGLLGAGPAVIEEFSPRDHPQPTAKGVAGTVAAKSLQRRCHRLEDLLADVIDLGAAQAPRAAPQINQRTVQVVQLLPGCLTAVASPLEQGQGCGLVVHEYQSSVPSKKMSQPTVA